MLHPFSTNSFEHVKKVLQPGEPTDSEWFFSNRSEEQPLQFRLTLKSDLAKSSGTISDLSLEFDNSFKFNLPDKMEVGASVVCNGSQELRIYDSKGRFIETYDIGRKPPILRKGAHSFRFDCSFSGDDDMAINLIVKQEGNEEKINL